MKILTHQTINAQLCGTPLAVATGFSRVELSAIPKMAVDEFGLVHGGFIFGLADYAAMIAVNDPNVTLGAAEVRFTKPVRVGDHVIAEARVLSEDGKKRLVQVFVLREDETVFEGRFTCFVLAKHVLA
ncbi:MAG: hotdog domain-containing protein [Desulfobacterales bacterium]|jgi:uncharacterized protein (TIGR00369 family)|nr:hotdog domain-containing protein [Desulfobacterales bacterium]